MATGIGDKAPERVPNYPFVEVGTHLEPFLRAPTAQLWDTVVAEVLKPIGIFRAPIMHTAGSAAARPARQLLGASDLQALFAGHTLYAEGWHRFPVYDRGPVHLYLAAGGRLFGTSPEGVDVGTWHITPDGQWCRTWYV
jgi:hypothetical protein